MQVFVDDIPMTDVEAGNKTVGELIDTLREHLQTDDRLVVQIECDGQTVSEDSLNSTLGRSARDFQRLDFQTQPTVDLARSALETIADILAQTDEGRAQTVEHLTTGNTPDAMKALGPCIKAWQRGFEGLIQVAALRNVSLDEPCVDGRTILAHIQEWSEQLKQIKGALEDQDFVLLTDILQYEFESTTDRWRQIIHAIAAEGGLGLIELPRD
jgi:hypothetical protein